MVHELNSILLYIHPPTAIISYFLIIFALIFMVKKPKKFNNKKWEKYTRIIQYSAWFFTLFGLVTGMVWAQVSWGSYWSWDPKESATLVIFVFLCLSILSNEFKKKKLAILFLIISIIAMVSNIYITLSNYGLHSYGLT